MLESVLNAESVAPNPDSEYIAWVREALEQTQQAHAVNSNATGNAYALQANRWALRR
jgi:hypothetical protein